MDGIVVDIRILLKSAGEWIKNNAEWDKLIKEALGLLVITRYSFNLQNE